MQTNWLSCEREKVNLLDVIYVHRYPNRMGIADVYTSIQEVSIFMWVFLPASPCPASSCTLELALSCSSTWCCTLPFFAPSCLASTEKLVLVNATIVTTRSSRATEREGWCIRRSEFRLVCHNLAPFLSMIGCIGLVVRNHI